MHVLRQLFRGIVEENGPAMGFQALEIGTSFMLYVLCSDEILSYWKSYSRVSPVKAQLLNGIRGLQELNDVAFSS